MFQLTAIYSAQSISKTQHLHESHCLIELSGCHPVVYKWYELQVVTFYYDTGGRQTNTNMRRIKKNPGFTTWETWSNLPIRRRKAFTVTAVLVAGHTWSKSRRSFSFLTDNVIVNVAVSISHPNTSSLVSQWHDFSFARSGGWRGEREPINRKIPEVKDAEIFRHLALSGVNYTSTSTALST